MAELNNEEFTAALALRDSYGDVDDLICSQANQKLMDAVYVELMGQFEEDVMPTLPSGI